MTYRGIVVTCAYRMDFVVNGAVVIEVKAVERLTHVHQAQMLSYLRISGLTVGLLINFNVKWLVDEGVKRLVNGFQE